MRNEYDRDMENMREHWEDDDREELCRRMVEAVRDGDEALAWQLAREYAGLPPEGE